MIHICCPVLKRYDLLKRMLVSLQDSTIKPDAVFIIDNGRCEARLTNALTEATCPTFVHTPAENLGVASSWNWFIENVDEERVIVNDDILFAPKSLEALLLSPCDLIWAKGCGFSCFVLRDRAVERIGMFDETLSPGYGYYEDEDYLQRLDGRGTKPRVATADEVESWVTHLHSQTLQASSHEELMEHHRKFKIAQGNYMKKWHLTNQDMGIR